MIARRITSLLAIAMALIVIVAGEYQPRTLDVTVDGPTPLPAPRSAPPPTVGLPRTAARPDTSLEAQTEAPAGSRALPDQRPSPGVDGASLVRPAIPGRGGVVEAEPTTGPSRSASRPADGGRVTAPPSRRPLIVRVTGDSIRGQATWYCLPGRSACSSGYDPGCTCAAAGPELRAALGDWRGRVVIVSTSHTSVPVRLVDFCSCPGDHVIDLFASTFAGLGPLSAGELAVTVSW